MGADLLVHIVAGSLGLVSGFVALFAAKGAPLHRRFGMVFVVTMLVMTTTGTLLAAIRGAAPSINVPAGVLTAYFVVTGLATVRPPRERARELHFGAMGVAFAVGLACLAFGFEALANGGTKDGMPAFPYFLFGVVGSLAAVQDVRMVRSGPPAGRARLVRHLWRMCFALFVAAMSFFLGQADEIPKAIRIPALLALPPLAVLVVMFSWLWRLRPRGGAAPLAAASAPEAG